MFCQGFLSKHKKKENHMFSTANVSYPKHNSERFFSFEEFESHAANIKNLWLCKILQRNYLNRPKERPT